MGNNIKFIILFLIIFTLANIYAIFDKVNFVIICCTLIIFLIINEFKFDILTAMLETESRNLDLEIKKLELKQIENKKR